MDLILFIQSFASPFMDKIAELVTMSGEENFLVILVAIIFWCVDKKNGYIMSFALLTSTILNVSLKSFFDMPRPIGTPGIRSLRVETATGSSFPSGHTQGASTFWMSFWLTSKKKVIGILGLFMALSVATTRMYLGVHWPRDVIAGLLIGAAVAIFIYVLFAKKEKHIQLILLLLVVLPSTLGLFFFVDIHYIKIVGLLLGLYTGYLIESRFINFQVSDTLRNSCLRVITGLVGLMIIKIGLSLILPSTSLFSFLRYAAIGLWLTVPAPLLFKQLKI